MIPIIGLIIAVYTIARSVAEVTSRKDGATSIVGKVGYVLCALATLFFVSMLMMSGASIPSHL
jgi:hypothetical protein